ncbi:MAG: isochorismatase family protein, partial [Acidimicrobiales bacterium]
TRDWHVDPGSHFAPSGTEPDYVETWPVHCRADTAGAELHPALRLPEGSVVVQKGEYSAALSGFEGHDGAGRTLDQILRDAAITDVDLAGIATSVCDRATALGAYARGFETRLLLSLCTDVTGADTEETLRELETVGVGIER